MSEHDYTGTVLDDQYRIINRIADGSSGSVYKAERLADRVPVAVKFMRTEQAGREVAVKRFFREARAASEVRHEKITAVLDVGVSSQNTPYLVMEYFEGETLAAMLKKSGPTNLGTACSVAHSILQALGAIHGQGVVHRDIRPSKIFVVPRSGQDPQLKLMDFGLSKFTDTGEQSNLTVGGLILGSPDYISPEQIKGAKDVDRRTDIYAVGVIMYQMLTGRLPFDARSYQDKVLAKLSLEPIAPLDAHPAFPVEATALVMSAIAQDPSLRPQTAEQMISRLRNISAFAQRDECLRRFVAGEVLPSDPSTPRGQQPIKQLLNFVPKLKEKLGNRWLMVGTGGGLLLVGTLLSVLMLSGAQARAPETHGVQHVRIPGARDPKDLPMSSQPAQGQHGAITQTSIPAEVQIEVRGMPSGARIYYEGGRILMNPFKVASKEVIVTLKVEAVGYEPFVTSLVPVQDQVVQVKLENQTDRAEQTADSDAEESVDEEEQDEVENKRAQGVTEKPQTQNEGNQRRPRRRPPRQRRGGLGNMGGGGRYSRDFN